MRTLDDASSPMVSVCVPVFNGEATARRCLDSILAQHFRDFEVVVSDNASTDTTPQILAEYAARDARLRVSREPSNVGRVENFNRVVALARGRYFCWVGIDDWLEPDYLASTVAALEARPNAVLATADFALVGDASVSVHELREEALESSSPARRFSRILSLYLRTDVYYDPMHGLIRRTVIGDRRPVLMAPFEDRVFTAEIALRSQGVHVPAVQYRRMEDRSHDPSGDPPLSLLLARFSRIVSEAALPALPRLQCRVATLAFVAREAALRLVRTARRFRRSRLGLTRERLRRIARPGA